MGPAPTAAPSAPATPTTPTAAPSARATPTAAPSAPTAAPATRPCRSAEMAWSRARRSATTAIRITSTPAVMPARRPSAPRLSRTSRPSTSMAFSPRKFANEGYSGVGFARGRAGRQGGARRAGAARDGSATRGRATGELDHAHEALCRLDHAPGAARVRPHTRSRSHRRCRPARSTHQRSPHSSEVQDYVCGPASYELVTDCDEVLGAGLLFNEGPFATNTPCMLLAVLVRGRADAVSRCRWG
jgi:hypothetical protein